MKKQRTLFSGLLILLGCAFLLFTGCPTGLTDEAGDPAVSRSLVNPAALADSSPVFFDSLILSRGLVSPVYSVYYNLATGERVDNQKTGPWDFGMEYEEDSGLVFFYTNSGVSGAGNGGVWYTDKVFNAVLSFADAVDVTGTEYAPYVTDVTRFAYGMGGDRYSTPMNIMTYFGFPGGDGLTDETAFTVNPYTPPDPLSSYIFYDFDKKAAYTDYGNMPPNLGPTGQVYIIRHSDGSTYSKLQITGFTLNANMTYSISLQFTEIPSSLQPGKAGPLAE